MIFDYGGIRVRVGDDLHDAFLELKARAERAEALNRKLLEALEAMQAALEAAVRSIPEDRLLDCIGALDMAEAASFKAEAAIAKARK